jgi:hypothetical protein
MKYLKNKMYVSGGVQLKNNQTNTHKTDDIHEKRWRERERDRVVDDQEDYSSPTKNT